LTLPFDAAVFPLLSPFPLFLLLLIRRPRHDHEGHRHGHRFLSKTAKTPEPTTWPAATAHPTSEIKQPLAEVT
jgi:hypothetical protein